MKISFTRFFGLVILIGLVLYWTLALAKDHVKAEFYLIFTGNTFGELKPCGCAREEDQGGVERRQTYLKRIRTSGKEVVLVDTGDSFKEPTQQGQIKARFIMKSMDRMFYDAVALGDKDLVYGRKFLLQFKSIPWVASNMELEEVGDIPPYRTKRLKNGIQISILSLSGSELFYSGTQTGLVITSTRKTLRFLLNQIHQFENPDFVVLITHMPREKALQFLETEDIDVIINGHIEKETDIINMDAVRKNGKLFVQASPRGQKVGEILVSLSSDQTINYQHQMVRLDSHIPFDPEMVKLYDDYNRTIEEIFFETLAARRNQFKEKVFATETACKTCHAKAHTIWRQSRHGRAYETLKKVNKAFDPECLVCHTVGFNESGGFVSENDTPELANVQCEVCHGPGQNHLKNPKPGWSLDAAKACKKCHVKNHSPRFNFAKYWLKIQH